MCSTPEDAAELPALAIRVPTPEGIVEKPFAEVSVRELNDAVSPREHRRATVRARRKGAGQSYRRGPAHSSAASSAESRRLDSPRK